MRRKLLAIAVALCLLCCGSAATAANDFDLSELSFEELIALKEQINLAIWNSAEWEEVEIPVGVYTIGSDIPAGHWTIKCAEGREFINIAWGEKLDASGEEIEWSERSSTSNFIYNSDDEFYQKGDVTEYSCELMDGEYVVIEYGSALFMPYAGKQSFGFKAFSKSKEKAEITAAPTVTPTPTETTTSVATSTSTVAPTPTVTPTPCVTPESVAESAKDEIQDIITAIPKPTEIPSENNILSNYMRDNSGRLLLNDSVTPLFRSNANLESYFTELLTATVDYSLLCIEADGKLNAESMTSFLLKFMDLYDKMSKETTLKSSLSDEELEAYKDTMNLLLNISTWALDTETWTDEKRSTYVETLSMYLEAVCVPIQ